MRAIARCLALPLTLALVVLLPAFVGRGVEGKGEPPTIEQILGTWIGKSSGVVAPLPSGQLQKLKDIGELVLAQEDADHVRITGFGPTLYGRYQSGVVVIGGYTEDDAETRSYTGFLAISGTPGKLKMKGMLCAADEISTTSLYFFKLAGKWIAPPGRKR